MVQKYAKKRKLANVYVIFFKKRAFLFLAFEYFHYLCTVLIEVPFF